MVALLLSLAARAELVRDGRLAMGTAVGVTVVAADRAAAAGPIDAAYAAIERWEAELSEWRPDSAVARLNATGGPVVLSPLGDRLFWLGEALRTASRGAFSLTWQGGRLRHGADGWRVEGGVVGLGGVLKGFLCDRAGDALRAAGVRDFLVDAAGDVLAGGSAEGADGWTVELPVARRRVVLHDEALSTSGDDQQPGHIRDAAHGVVAGGLRQVTVVAESGALADGLATAMFASGGRRGLAEGFRARAWLVDLRGHVTARGTSGRRSRSR